jgi:YgiT-type zinc finger domain-containing protein
MAMIEEIRKDCTGSVEFSQHAQETMVEQKVTYTLEVDGKFIIIENVPARVCLGCNGRFGFEWHLCHVWR